MGRFVTALSIFVVLISIISYNSSTIKSLLKSSPLSVYTTSHLSDSQLQAIETSTSEQPMLNAARNTMSKTLYNAKITTHLSSARGHGDHGWLNTHHSFSFSDWHNPKLMGFGALRVLNEDRVKANSGFPTHRHNNFEIFSYILSGELTHRDSMLKKGAEGGQSDRFFRMHRGDVQFTTGGTGIAHSEFNEHNRDTVHFLQIWAVPWARGLTPRYHTRHFDDDEKRNGFVNILSPLKAGVEATTEEEKAAEPTIPDTIPIHADLVMAAGIIAPGAEFEWTIGAKATGAEGATKRKVYIHLPMTKGGKSKIRLDGREDAELEEGDGAFVEDVTAGDSLVVESIGEEEAEVIVLDTNRATVTASNINQFHSRWGSRGASNLGRVPASPKI